MGSPVGVRAVLGDIPVVSNLVGELVDNTVGWAWDKVASGIAKWVLGAVGYFVNGVLNFLKTSAKPDVEAAWFKGADSPYATVRNIAALLLLGFVFLGIIQGLLANDVRGMVRRVAADLPAAVIGMIATTAVVAKLIELTDALSTGVLAHSNDQAVHFLSGFGVSVTSASQGFAAVILGLVAVVAGLFVWVELMVRSVLVYLLVALSPLSFAAMVWPAARSVLRRTVELLLAVIFSKLVVCIAMSVGVAALAGAGSSGGSNAGVGDAGAVSMGTLFVGTAVLAMAAFAPFLLLRLIPIAEAALVAQGMSRAPVRAAQSTMGNVTQVNSIARLSGGSQGAAAIGTGSGGGGWIVGAPLPGAPAGIGGTAAAAGPGAVAVAVGTAGVSGGSKAVQAASDLGSGLASRGSPPAAGTALSDGTPRASRRRLGPEPGVQSDASRHDEEQP